MFITAKQFYVFVACFAIGSACGILFSVSAAIKKFIKPRVLSILPDFTAFVLTACICVFASYALKFPNFRPYMPAGVLTGIYAYMKSYHILLAKCGKKAYNLVIRKNTTRNAKDKRKCQNLK